MSMRIVKLSKSRAREIFFGIIRLYPIDILIYRQEIRINRMDGKTCELNKQYRINATLYFFQLHK